jgi:glycosyltransferase involved in cell wall biosynthesis
MRLALVHDWLKNISGAERVLIELHHIFPDAPIYTLFYDKQFIRQWLPSADIRPSFLQKIPFITKLYPLFGWLMPTAIESFDLSEFDKVLSSSAIFSKGLVLKPSTKHICYCYSPSRFLWDWHAEYVKDKSTSWPALFYQHFLRLWDRASADRVDQFVAISKTVQQRIKKYYRRDSVVIYPPVRLASSQTHGLRARSNNFYLIVSRLHKYKNIDIAIEAFNKLGYSLVIIGDGPDRGRLRKMAAKNITFLGEQDDTVLTEYYSACRAFIMSQEEDFGLTPIEAMSFGKPVVALRRGGALETILEGQTGEFFDDPIPEALADALRRLNENYSSYNPETIKSQASLFGLDRFKSLITALVA